MRVFRSATLRTFPRQAKRQKRKTAEELLIQKEGVVYGAGIAD